MSCFWPEELEFVYRALWPGCWVLGVGGSGGGKKLRVVEWPCHVQDV